jgi:hypothetical protein
LKNRKSPEKPNKGIAGDANDLLETLRSRFERNMVRHKGVEWRIVNARLKDSPEFLAVIGRMEQTGGEPDVVSIGPRGSLIFADCSPETPAGRRSLCYDTPALKARKEFKPKDSAVAMAAAIGVELMTEEQYRALQELGEFDVKTSSWIQTPPEVRKLGGALFCDRRYGRVFVYHNGAESYYGVRGFRGFLKV